MPEQKRDWRQRLVDERDEVACRVVRLVEFLEEPGLMGTETVEDRVGKDQKRLLQIQLDAMRTYLGVLHWRLHLLEKAGWDWQEDKLRRRREKALPTGAV